MGKDIEEPQEFSMDPSWGAHHARQEGEGGTLTRGTGLQEVTRGEPEIFDCRWALFGRRNAKGPRQEGSINEYGII